MKIINVYGDGDYAASFIEHEYGVERAYEKAVANGGKVSIEGGDYQQAYVEVVEFGAVDEKFIAYIRDKQDYDMTKHSNFFVIDEAY
ncbi:hypothetical protein ACJGE4_15425 [Bacillus velezensis]|uniref:hypothetical protein n=1 Tax=Bacillus velezensis TaxID=492670 RepID=UPI000C05963D|nr:hypothetical protein [Bacillus velezensis]ATO12204.1 hypothetical protein CRH11_20370 [Bacillus velezensis]AZI48215.1 hypothetical protein BVMH_15500 [Bacillus velezensis]